MFYVNKKEEIKELRKKMGLSKAKFAKRLGLSRSYLQQLENGKRKLENASKKFRMKLDDLFFESLARSAHVCEVECYIMEKESLLSKLKRFILKLFR